MSEKKQKGQFTAVIGLPRQSPPAKSGPLISVIRPLPTGMDFALSDSNR
jgi:hypothetical protein